ncbi:MAG: hypothetical protein JOY66_05915 [Acetobacteraceae bacterium]|nr:hypothetical protein [Acetobacteraceae bacterium]
MSRQASMGAGVVAVIEGDADVLDSLRFLLEAAGFAPAAYRSAAQFLDEDPRRPAGCLIADQREGLELAHRLHLAGLDLPILLMADSPSPALSANAALLGVRKVLAKPFDPEEALRFAAEHS